jgi:hypothetical protein
MLSNNGATRMEDHEEPAILAEVPAEIEAQLIVAALEAEGIEAFKSGGYASDFRVLVPGHIKILVRPEDLDRAKEAFAHLRDDDGEINWSDINAGNQEEQ